MINACQEHAVCHPLFEQTGLEALSQPLQVTHLCNSRPMQNVTRTPTQVIAHHVHARKLLPQQSTLQAGVDGAHVCILAL